MPWWKELWGGCSVCTHKEVPIVGDIDLSRLERRTCDKYLWMSSTRALQYHVIYQLVWNSRKGMIWQIEETQIRHTSQWNIKKLFPKRFWKVERYFARGYFPNMKRRSANHNNLYFTISPSSVAFVRWHTGLMTSEVRHVLFLDGFLHWKFARDRLTEIDLSPGSIICSCINVRELRPRTMAIMTGHYRWKESGKKW